MEDSDFLTMVRDIEVAKGRLTSHERECAIRYKSLDDTISDMNSKLDRVIGRVDTTAAGWTAKQIAGMGAVITLLLGALAWTGGQLYALEPLRAAAEISK